MDKDVNIKYGKSSKELLQIKNDFFINNKANLKRMNDIKDIYVKQPKREFCKMCGNKLNEISFCSHGINYYICPECNHLNGEYEDNEEFSDEIYVDSNYGYTYNEAEIEKYNKRVNDIYIPKIEFLINNIEMHTKNRVLDIGAGSGYFVAAGRNRGLNIQGIEISEQQVEYGNKMMKDNLLRAIKYTDTTTYLKHTDCNIISMIGVLEHTINMHDVLEAIANNINISYLYISVPMISFSCIFEASNANVFNRHLGGAHTHLFSFASLKWMEDKYGFEEVAKWQFGSDIMDLFRGLNIQLEMEKNERLKELFANKFIPIIDELQFVLDKSDFSSEVHLLLQKKS